jgi:hypothetical protein
MEKLEKEERSVTIRTSDGRTIYGKVFSLSTERISDLVNNESQFIPVELENGIEIVNKDHIISILELRKNL